MRKARLARILAVALTLLPWLGGCETVPKPFRHPEGSVSTLARPKLERGIALHTADGLPQAEALAEQVIKAFEDNEVPVTLRRGRGFGRVIEVGQENERLVWRLNDADGSELQRLETSVSQAPRVSAALVASRFLPALEDPDAKPQAGPDRPPPLLQVRVQAMKGLPGDGDTTLPRALTKALERQRIAVSDDAPYTVVGVVSVTHVSATEDNVALSWLIKKGDAAGPQLAAIDQGGSLPRGRLDLPWGSLARDIAEGGAATIAEVVRLAERNREEQESTDKSRRFTEQEAADIGKSDSNEPTDPARTNPLPPSTTAPSAATAVPEAPSSPAPSPSASAQKQTTKTVGQPSPPGKQATAKKKKRTSKTGKSSKSAKPKQVEPTPSSKPDR